MFCSKAIAVHSILLLLFVASVSTVSLQVDPCRAQRRCSFEEIIVRALTPDGRCLLFRNNCLYTNDLCSRRANRQPPLKLITRAECRAKCTEKCTEKNRPVCANHNGADYTFSSRCDLDKQACKRDKSYIVSYEEKCKKAGT